jgi:RHS repeat-associated protein
MKHACAGLRAVIGCSFFCSLSPAAAVPTPPPVSPPPTTRYEYDAMGHVTKILRGASGDSTSISYDSVYRVTSITDAKQGAIRFGYWGMTPYINKVTDPRGLETLYERTGLGHVAKIVSPDTGTTEFTYVPGTMLVETALDSRGVLTRYTYDAGERLRRAEYSRGGWTDPALIWTYSEQGPEFSYGMGRLTSMRHGTGGDRYRYDDQGDVTTHTQWVERATGANSSTVRLQVEYVRRFRDLEGITYPSGRRLVIPREYGKALSLALAKDGASVPMPLISGLRWAPFGLGVNGWNWHTSGGLVPHERLFDLSGRMVRYPVGRVLRDVRYDAQDRIAAFTHQRLDGTPQPALDQQFAYDELDRLTSVVTAASSWSIGYDPNSNRASVSLNGIPSRYDTEPTSNRLSGVTNPARNLAYDNTGNTTSDGAGYTATYNLAGQLATLTKGGVTTTYTYNAMGQRIRKVSSVGPQSTVIYLYDEEGQLLGEYDHEGRAIREYVWLQNVPIAVFAPNAADANGPPLVFYIHADHLNAPRAVVDTDGMTRWRWLAEPFGTTAPEVDPSGRGPLAFGLRFPGQVADAESGLFYNDTRYYDSTLGRYTTADRIGQAGGINLYGYVDGNPVNAVDPTGEFGILGGLVGGLGNLGYQLYMNGGNLKCVNPWEVASWALMGSGAGLVGRAGLAGVGRFFWDPRRWSSISKGYWTARGGAGASSLDHWMVSRSFGASIGLPSGLTNAGLNLVQMPRRMNSFLGGFLGPGATRTGSTDAAMALGRIGANGTILGTAALGGAGGYITGTLANQDPECGCR